MAKLRLSMDDARRLGERHGINGTPKWLANEFASFAMAQAYALRYDVLSQVKNDMDENFAGAAAVAGMFRQLAAGGNQGATPARGITHG